MAYEPVVDFPGKTFYNRFAERFPVVKQFPLLIVPAEQTTPEQLRATPAIYQFSTADANRSIFLGPRMVTANVRGWPGYDEYRSFVGEVIGSYFELNNARLERYSLGFYNRIPVSSVDEIREIVTAPLDLRDNASMYELIAQSARETEAGSVVTQIVTNAPDNFTREPFLAINNIIRSIGPADDRRNRDALLEWLDTAHEIGKEMIWSVLSDKVKEIWKKS